MNSHTLQHTLYRRRRQNERNNISSVAKEITGALHEKIQFIIIIFSVFLIRGSFIAKVYDDAKFVEYFTAVIICRHR